VYQRHQRQNYDEDIKGIQSLRAGYRGILEQLEKEDKTSTMTMSQILDWYESVLEASGVSGKKDASQELLQDRLQIHFEFMNLLDSEKFKDKRNHLFHFLRESSFVYRGLADPSIVLDTSP